MNDPDKAEYFHERVSGIDLVPLFGEVGAVGTFVMIVLHELAHEEEIDRQ